MVVESPGGGREKQGVVGVEARCTRAYRGRSDALQERLARGADKGVSGNVGGEVCPA